MKTMTCAQLGGPCQTAHTGESADEMAARWADTGAFNQKVMDAGQFVFAGA
ncbi:MULTISPECIES: hypothetical protein [Kytococcus]|uniref:hypothetical protein n=1 Tax=Kytococcus TaxID=57499 RepID=UPI001438B36A|nr:MULTISPECIES: hypothetical protein [Kytococcus]